jgi:hypothetical protein
MKIPQLIEDNKHIFGTYSAMALMNIRTVFNHIQNITGLEGEFKEASEAFWHHPVMLHLKDVRNSNLPKESTQKVIERLLHSFPFLYILAENQRVFITKKRNENRTEINCDDIYTVLNWLLNVIAKYRNYTNHYFIESSDWRDGSDFLKYNEQILANALVKYYVTALRNVKERFNYSTAQLAFIQDHLYQKTWANGRSIMCPNVEFPLSLINKSGDIGNIYHISAVGVVLTICLFLEKKYIQNFVRKTQILHIYPEQSEEHRIIMRSLGINSIRLPKERIRSDKKDMSVALDMLNELKRCPKELFDTLDFSNQSRFRIISTDHNEVLQMRHTDRFAQLALNYIDSNKLFERIRFHVNMGKLRYLFAAEKHCIDGQTRVRVIEHPLNGYGRLEDMEEERISEQGNFASTNIPVRTFEQVERDDANPKNYPYVVDTYTNYLLQHNKVEMCFSKENLFPNIVQEGGKWYVEKEIPACRMSTLEIPAMMFHIHLLGSHKTEQRIKDVHDKYMSLFNALADGKLNQSNINSFGIPLCDIPQKVIDAVNGVSTGKDYNSYIHEEVNSLLEDSIRRIERIKEDRRTVNSATNKMGKPGFKRIMPGKLAEFIARDIVKFQPSFRKGDAYGTDRITGLNFRVMQATIATYNDEGNAFEELKQLFTDAHLIGGIRKYNHPFLYAALQRRPGSTVDFYQNYLFARKRYLERINSDLNKGIPVTLPFVNENSTKWVLRDKAYYQTLGGTYADELAIELPRQMFDNDIKDKLKQYPEMQGIDFENANVTYLIAEYFKRVHHDDVQEFYAYLRNYRYIDLLTCETDRKNSLIKQYTDTAKREALWEARSERVEVYKSWALRKKANDRNFMRMSDSEFSSILDKRLSACRNDFQKSEKLIRRFKVQDIMLFLMAKDKLNEHLDFEAKSFKLQDITPDADRGIMSEIMPIDFTFDKNGKKYTIHSDGMKLKNYGEFFALANDKRFTSLLKIISAMYVNKEEIEEEFDNYDTCRPSIVKLIMEFEKGAFSKYPEMRDLVTEENHFDFSKILTFISDKGEIDLNDSKVLSQVRNAFSHNQYPNQADIVEIRTLPEIAKHLIDLFERHSKK